MTIIQTEHETIIEAQDYAENPDGTSFVRVVLNDGSEVGYWAAEEFRDDPVGTLGAFIGAVRSGKTYDPPPNTKTAD